MAVVAKKQPRSWSAFIAQYKMSLAIAGVVALAAIIFGVYKLTADSAADEKQKLKDAIAAKDRKIAANNTQIAVLAQAGKGAGAEAKRLKTENGKLIKEKGKLQGDITVLDGQVATANQTVATAQETAAEANQRAASANQRAATAHETAKKHKETAKKAKAAKEDATNTSYIVGGVLGAVVVIGLGVAFFAWKRRRSGSGASPGNDDGTIRFLSIDQDLVDATAGTTDGDEGKRTLDADRLNLGSYIRAYSKKASSDESAASIDEYNRHNTVGVTETRGRTNKLIEAIDKNGTYYLDELDLDQEIHESEAYQAIVADLETQVEALKTAYEATVPYDNKELKREEMKSVLQLAGTPEGGEKKKAAKVVEEWLTPYPTQMVGTESRDHKNALMSVIGAYNNVVGAHKRFASKAHESLNPEQLQKANDMAQTILVRIRKGLIGDQAHFNDTTLLSKPRFEAEVRGVVAAVVEHNVRGFDDATGKATYAEEPDPDAGAAVEASGSKKLKTIYDTAVAETYDPARHQYLIYRYSSTVSGTKYQLAQTSRADTTPTGTKVRRYDPKSGMVIGDGEYTQIKEKYYKNHRGISKEKFMELYDATEAAGRGALLAEWVDGGGGSGGGDGDGGGEDKAADIVDNPADPDADEQTI